MSKFIFMLSVLFCLLSAGADEYLDSSASRSGMTFYCSFDGKFDADQANGVLKGTYNGNNKTCFVPGLKKQALRIGADDAGKNRSMLRFPALKNISAEQGTMLFWFKPVNWKNHQMRYQHLVSATGNSSFYAYQMLHGKIGVAESVGKKGGNVGIKTSHWQDQEWHHFAAVWDKVSCKIYIDGQPFGSMKREMPNGTRKWNNLYIGALNWGESRVRGLTDIDELKIFNRPLSNTEIANEYTELGQSLGNRVDRFIIRCGKSTAKTDGVISADEYAASGNGFLTMEGSYAPIQGKWHLGFDAQYLYAAMESPISAKPVAKVTKRDGAVYGDDSVELDIQTGDSSIKQIVVNTNGTIYDSRIANKKHYPEWNLKQIKTASTIRNGIWCVELAIPLAELGKPDQSGKYRLNFSRALLDPKSITRGICTAPIRRKRGFLDVDKFIDFYLDPAAPAYRIDFSGDLNIGEVKIDASSSEKSQLRANYLSGGRLWFDERLNVQRKNTEIRKSMPPNGILTTELTQNGKMLYRSMLIGKSPSPLTVQYIYTEVAKQQLQVALKNESGIPGGSLLVQIKDRKNGVVHLEKKFSVTSSSVFFDVTLDLAKLAPGDYDVCCTPLDKNGKTQKGEFIQILRKPGAPEVWRNNKVGVYPGEVPPPWIPIRAKGNEVAMKMQSYRFENTLFPSWFGTHKSNLFTRPAQLLINGKEVKNAKFVIDKTAADVVYAHTTGTLGQLNVRADFRFEYDGMIWVKLNLNSKNFVLNTLELHFPLRREEGNLVHSNTGVDTHTATFGNNGMLKDQLWHKNLYSTPVFWVGGDHLGLCWFAENLKNWRNKQVNNSVEITPNGEKERLVKLIMVDQPVKISGDYAFEFGLQGSPVKPPANRNDIKRWAYYSHSTKYFDYHEPTPEFFKRDSYERAWDSWVKKLKVPYFYYCSSNGFSPYAPEWSWYAKEWIAGKIGQYTIEYPIRNMQDRNRHVWTFACLNCKSFFDFKTWQIGRLITIKDYHLDNIYYDLVGPRLCDNANHGCSWKDSNGNLWPSFNVLSVREFHKRMYHLSKKKNPEFLHLLHITGRARVLPVISFANGLVDGETFYGNEVVDKENYYGVFTPEMFRASYQTGSIGVDMSFIPQLVRAAAMVRPDRVKLWRSEPPPPEMYRALRHFAGYALTHNVFIWTWDPWTRKTVSRLYNEQLRHFGSLRGLQFISYWEPEKPYRVACSVPERTMVSVLKNKDRAVMYIMNDTPQEQKIQVTVDAQKLLGSSAMQVWDFEKEHPAKQKDNTLTVTLPARYFSIHFLKPVK